MGFPLLLSAALSSLSLLLAATYRLLGAKPLAHAAVMLLAAVAAAQAIYETPTSWVPIAVAAAIEAALFKGEEPWR